MATKDELPQEISDRNTAAENKADTDAMDKYVVQPVKSIGKRLYENVMGTPEQNKYYEDKEKTKKMKSGGKVSSASKRADGIASKGKTKGTMC